MTKFIKKSNQVKFKYYFMFAKERGNEEFLC